MPKKLSSKDRARISEMLHTGFTAAQIARIYNLHPVYIRRAFKADMKAAHECDRERGLKHCRYPNVKHWICKHTEIDLNTLAQYAGVKEKSTLQWMLSRRSLPDDFVSRLMRITRLSRDEITYQESPTPITIDGYTIPPKE